MVSSLLYVFKFIGFKVNFQCVCVTFPQIFKVSQDYGNGSVVSYRFNVIFTTSLCNRYLRVTYSALMVINYLRYKHI